jgi:hypothetical protein
MTEQERFEIYGERLTEFRAKQAIAQQRCDELNKDKTKLNRMGGIGYHVIYARCVCNPAKNRADSDK